MVAAAEVTDPDEKGWNAPLTDEQAVIFKKLRLVIYALCLAFFAILLSVWMAPGVRYTAGSQPFTWVRRGVPRYWRSSLRWP